ncbi:helix-turn-helix domain-containing protein [Metasolibacillus meyeri]|uniref:Helix-turn-helix domain-containing protein n=1 Tax=Metasolibacillus meyeri TaxID=1071052 RepID=A0AAW9NTP2_9BACL|nr:helix-turn-helix domain-containing protein [Metasolibacillus meyeri]MEC1177865.1 helix-turn-helix domain-containing protein [Metasolibacillus meyeri]
MTVHLQSLFSTYQRYQVKPDTLSEDVYFFYCTQLDEWFSITKHEVSARDYEWLSMLYHEVLATANTLANDWYTFLYRQGDIPLKQASQHMRVIQLVFASDLPAFEDLSEAILSFFHSDAILIQSTAQQLLVIEHKAHSMNNKEDFIALIRTLEADFFANIHLYQGEFYKLDENFPANFRREAQWFEECRHYKSKEYFYSFEAILPILLTKQMPPSILQFIEQQILIPLQSDEELLQTIKVFYECGLNSSVTSKKLHIHRNTLNYRLQKFQDITNISTKSMDGAIIVYFASFLQTFSKNAQK